MPPSLHPIPSPLKEGISLGPSRQLAMVLLSLSALAVVALYLTHLEPMALSGGVLLIGWWLVDAGAKHVTRTASSAIVSLGWYEDGTLWCLNGAGEHHRCTLLSSFLGEWLTFLLLRDEVNTKYAVLISTDNVDRSKRHLVRSYLWGRK